MLTYFIPTLIWFKISYPGPRWCAAPMQLSTPMLQGANHKLITAKPHLHSKNKKNESGNITILSNWAQIAQRTGSVQWYLDLLRFWASY